MLSPRQERILKSIVGQYIVRAVPVPSQSLLTDHELGVSSATIRNEMAHLEEEGYITRPHPSAGSMPSDRGYRYYVDALNEIELPSVEQRLINHLFHQVERELEEWLSLAATITARLAQNMAVVTMSKPVNCQLKHLELVSLQDSLALVVLVLHGAKVRQQLINFDQAINQPELTAIANKLNAAYANLTRPQILAKVLELSPAEQQVTDGVLKMMLVEDEHGCEEPYCNGLHFMLNQPEFAHSQRILNLLELIEHRKLLKVITPAKLTSRQVQVVIGKENEAEVFHDYSVVVSQYGLPEGAIGTIGVIGPTRMPYARTISAVGYLSSVLSRMVAELYG
jgi:heat-inducible transcriptional repressor